MEVSLKHVFVFSYNAKGNDDKESNMAVLEVELPSGYTYEKDLLDSLLKVENVKKFETKNGDTTVVVYFDSLSEKAISLTVNGFQSHKVAEQKPASVILYDYYDNCKILKCVTSAQTDNFNILIHFSSESAHFLQPALTMSPN